MANKANNFMELKPVMTKAKALELILEYVSNNGIPELDAVVYTDRVGNDHNCWTYQGLCKLLIGE